MTQDLKETETDITVDIDNAIDDDFEQDSPKKKTEIPVEMGIEELKAQLEESKAASLKAAKEREEERNARIRAEHEALSARSEMKDSHLSLIETAIATKRSDVANIKARYATALATGDYEGAADLQEQMATSTAEILQLEQGKTALKNQQSQPKKVESSDPVEDFASQLSPRSADWVRRHPEYVKDQRLYQKMVAAHQLAVADGVPVDSDEYFSSLESTLRIAPKAPPVHEDATEGAAKASGGRRIENSPPPAPPSRGSTPGSPSQKTIRLRPDEVEMAEAMGMTLQEYAKNKMELQRAGKLTA